jgi:subtilisin family serine protease
MRAFRRWVVLFVAALVAGSLAPVHGAGASAAKGPRTTYVVLADSAKKVDRAVAAVKAAGGQVRRVNRDIGVVSATSTDVGFIKTVNAKSGVAGVARDTVIGRAPHDVVSRPSTVEREGRNAPAARSGRGGPVALATTAPKGRWKEPLASYQWDMRMISATPPGPTRNDLGSKEVLVGVIDTGIDGNHPDIAPNFERDLSRNFTVDIPEVDGACANEPDGSCNDAADVDENGHGTHVAGTIASPVNRIGIAGVAPNARLVNLRAGQDSGYFFLQPTIDALTYAGDNGIDVVNMSFFIDPWLFNCDHNPADLAEEQVEQQTIIEATQRALDYARSHGVTLVAAIGNEHTDLGAATNVDVASPDFPPGVSRIRTVTNDCLVMPAEGDGVISVSSVGPSMRKSDFSNHGLEQNDVAAPGGFFRDGFGTATFRTPENEILAPYPKALALASGQIDPVTGASFTPAVVAQCSTPNDPDTCSYYQFLQGTSMAAPHAVGVAALIVRKYGRGNGAAHTMDPAKVEKILKNSATDVPCPAAVISYLNEGRTPDYDAPCVGDAARNSIYGDGIVNAKKAIG